MGGFTKAEFTNSGITDEIPSRQLSNDYKKLLSFCNRFSEESFEDERKRP